MDAIMNFLQQTGFYLVQQNPLNLIMLVVACLLLYLAIVLSLIHISSRTWSPTCSCPL